MKRNNIGYLRERFDFFLLKFKLQADDEELWKIKVIKINKIVIIT